MEQMGDEKWETNGGGGQGSVTLTGTSGLVSEDPLWWTNSKTLHCWG